MYRIWGGGKWNMCLIFDEIKVILPLCNVGCCKKLMGKWVEKGNERKFEMVR